MTGRRAKLDAEKRQMLEALLQSWLQVPSLRLGQLLENACMSSGKRRDLFYVEDADMLSEVQTFVRLLGHDERPEDS